ncbi:hypothetical protein GCM10009416_24430 [Craurococcus roseus]|uniref:Uncharacterized protein n=1 Tax=Craurococcus roseus TaxID=77585 RepID=A0ABN1F8L5_9PROT
MQSAGALATMIAAAPPGRAVRDPAASRPRVPGHARFLAVSAPIPVRPRADGQPG